MGHSDMEMGSTPSTDSVRLIFEYEGDQIRLISQQAVDMVAPPTQPVARDVQQPGFFVQVRSTAEDLLYQQAAQDPAAHFPEVFSDQPGNNIARSTTPAERGAFTVVVPRLPKGDHVSLVRTGPPPAPAARSLAQIHIGEVARFTLEAKP